MKTLTIDRAIELLQAAKEQIGGDKPILLTDMYLDQGTNKYRTLTVADHEYPPDEENAWCHISPMKKSDFGFSTAESEWIEQKPMTLDEMKELGLL